MKDPLLPYQIHGIARAGYATVFPQAIGMAATWDPSVVRTMGNVISTRLGPNTTRRSARTITVFFTA